MRMYDAYRNGPIEEGQLANQEEWDAQPETEDIDMPPPSDDQPNSPDPPCEPSPADDEDNQSTSTVQKNGYADHLGAVPANQSPRPVPPTKPAQSRWWMLQVARTRKPLNECSIEPVHSLFVLIGRRIGIDKEGREYNGLKAYKLQMETDLGVNAYEKLRYTFPKLDISLLKVLQGLMERLSGIDSQPLDCCVNSCTCFVGPHSELTKCPHCKAPRYKDSSHK